MFLARFNGSYIFRPTFQIAAYQCSVYTTSNVYSSYQMIRSILFKAMLANCFERFDLGDIKPFRCDPQFLCWRDSGGGEVSMMGAIRIHFRVRQF